MDPVDPPPVEPETPVELIPNTAVKPGIKSTEFWLVLAANVIALALAMLGKLDAEWAITTCTVLTALYTAVRHRLKSTTVKLANEELL